MKKNSLPAQTWESASLLYKRNHSASKGSEPNFPALKPHREVPSPNYMEMSLVSLSEGWVCDVMCGSVLKEGNVSNNQRDPGTGSFGCRWAACDVFLPWSLSAASMCHAVQSPRMEK